MEHRKFVSSKHKDSFLDYLYSEPDIEEKVPAVFYIHGAGSRGNDVSILENNSAIKEVVKNASGKAFIFAPQCHENAWFDLYETLNEFIETMKSDKRIDQKRVYVIGSSMGGYTTWQLIISHPEWYAAAIPICGGGMYWNAQRITNIPIWAFHGLIDPTVYPNETINMTRKINSLGGKAKITIFSDLPHNSWVRALSDQNTWEWLFDQEKSDEN